jgi:hypothetical protein
VCKKIVLVELLLWRVVGCRLLIGDATDFVANVPAFDVVGRFIVMHTSKSFRSFRSPLLPSYYGGLTNCVVRIMQDFWLLVARRQYVKNHTAIGVGATKAASLYPMQPRCLLYLCGTVSCNIDSHSAISTERFKGEIAITC